MRRVAFTNKRYRSMMRARPRWTPDADLAEPISMAVRAVIGSGSFQSSSTHSSGCIFPTINTSPGSVPACEPATLSVNVD